MDGDEVHRQSLYRELDARRRNGPSRPIFRIGGSVIRDRRTDDEAHEQVASKETTPSNSKADSDNAAAAPPTAASYNTSSDLERGEQRTNGERR